MNILRLKDILNEKGVTGKELALNINVSENTVSNIVNGKNFPKPSLLLDIAKYLDVDIKELFISTKPKEDSPIQALHDIKIIAEQALENAKK